MKVQSIHPGQVCIVRPRAGGDATAFRLCWARQRRDRAAAGVWFGVQAEFRDWEIFAAPVRTGGPELAAEPVTIYPEYEVVMRPDLAAVLSPDRVRICTCRIWCNPDGRGIPGGIRLALEYLPESLTLIVEKKEEPRAKPSIIVSTNAADLAAELRSMGHNIFLMRPAEKSDPAGKDR